MQAQMRVEQARKAARVKCFTVEEIELRQRKLNNFTVIYGLQVKENLDYRQAALELGSCIMHKAACEGILNNQ